MDSQRPPRTLFGEHFPPFSQNTLPSTPPIPSQQHQPSSSQRDGLEYTPTTPMSTPMSFQLSQPTLFTPSQSDNPCSHNSQPWTNIFRPMGGGANLQGLSTPYNPTSFSSTSKLVGCIRDVQNLIQRVDSTLLTEKDSVEGLIGEMKKVLESMATEGSAKLEERDKKLAEQLEMLKRSVEKVCEKSGDVNDIHEGLKKVGERVEEIGTVIGKMEERQDSMLKEIEVIRNTANEMKQLIEQLCSRQPTACKQPKQLSSLNPSHKRPAPAEETGLSGAVRPASSSSAGPHPPIIIYNISDANHRPMSRSSNSSLAWDGETPSEMMQTLIKRRKLALEEWMEGVQNF